MSTDNHATINRMCCQRLNYCWLSLNSLWRDIPAQVCITQLSDDDSYSVPLVALGTLNPFRANFARRLPPAKSWAAVSVRSVKVLITVLWLTPTRSSVRPSGASGSSNALLHGAQRETLPSQSYLISHLPRRSAFEPDTAATQ